MRRRSWTRTRYSPGTARTTRASAARSRRRCSPRTCSAARSARPTRCNCARDPDFDGLGATSSQGLPELAPIKHLALLNGGSEIEFFRYARHGETVKLRSRYADIVEKETSKGPMLFVTIETEYRNGDDDLLMTARRTLIRR